ncbi:uncharacterized protein LOC113523262 isoform X2 [Galleria mellonella]|uniref:Uncharacterized protein LOC113523262 isoform X2 n=1 Tax=Galleria mellonella TaxID=7137 RepID=A0A6J1X519_GALME|nr:uncharacterized protein LOC113523262 isoform X2 [Galleria mellonella]
MMLTIHGLPLATKYHDVKVVIKRECNLADFILDNLVSDEDGCKKIRIGVADESEGAHLMKCLNGYRMGGQMLRVVPVGKASLNSAPQPAFEQRDNFPPRNDYLSHMTDYNQSRPSQPTQPWATNQWPQNQSANTTNNFNYQQSTPNQPYIHQQPQTQRMVQPFSNRMPVQEPMYTGGVRPMAPKALMPDPQQPHHMDSRSHVLRSIEIVDQPVNRANVSARYPGNQNYEQQKPITIMKNNFQGPTQYPGGQQNASQNYPIQSQAPTWQLQGAQQKPHPFSKDNPPFKPQYDDDRKYPDRHSSTKNPENRDLSNYEKSRGFSPRRSPMGRGMSPGRKMSPDRNIHRLHGGSDRRTLIGPDGRLHDPDGRSHGQDGRSHGQDGRSHGQDGRNRGPDKRPHSSDGRSHGPDGRPHGPDGRSKGPDGRPHGPDGRSQGPDGRPRGGPEGRHGLLGPGGRPLAGPDERRMSPGKRGILSGRRSPPSDRRTSPSSKRVSPSERRFSPPGRRISPPGRRISPPGRRISPSGRRMSPSGRQMSPPGRRMSPSRRISPSGRRISPGRRLAERTGPPNHRLESPPRPPPSSRYSPSRHHSDKLDSAHSIPKQVRPAYEPDSQAPNQAMYSGGYRPNIRENVQYPKPGGRQGEHHHSPWQDRENPVFSSKKLEEDRRERMPMSRGSDRLLDHGVELKRQPSPRKSRSPGRRDRSPLRDRYRRHSPSPRSPRRSWALEKRRSPVEAPPPPIWPGPSTHDEDKYTRSGRPDFHDKDEPSKPMVWERPTFHQKNEDPHRDRRSIPEAFGDDSSKLRRDLGEFPKRDQPKFSPREDFRRQEISEQKRHSDREEYREFPSHSEREARGNMRRQELLRRPEERLEDYRKRQQIFDKELDDVYNRAVEFAKKTDEMRREDRRRAASDERRREDTQREERHFHREKEPRRDFHDARPEDRHSRHEERPRSRYSDEYNRESREREWNTGNVKKWTILDPEVKIKRDKASEEICNKILQKHLNVIHSEEMKHHITEQLKGVLFKRLHEMFGNDDVSFIEMVIKFSSSIAGKEEDKLFNDAMSKLPPQLRYLKRSAPETSEVPAKTFKHSSDPNLNGARQAPVISKPRYQNPVEMDRFVRPNAVPAKKFAKAPEPKASRPVPPRGRQKHPLVGKEKIVKLKPAPIKQQVRPREPKLQRVVPASSRARPAVPPKEKFIKKDPAPAKPQTKPSEQTVKEPPQPPQPKPKDTPQLATPTKISVKEESENLLIKIRFSEPPQRDSLGNFLKKYNFVSFKRASMPPKTYEGRVKTKEDFDAICAATDLRCGSSKLTVTPHSNFNQCPENLKMDIDVNKIEASSNEAAIKKELTQKVNTKDKTKVTDTSQDTKKVITEDESHNQKQNILAETEKVSTAIENTAKPTKNQEVLNSSNESTPVKPGKDINEAAKTVPTENKCGTLINVESAEIDAQSIAKVTPTKDVETPITKKPQDNNQNIKTKATPQIKSNQSTPIAKTKQTVRKTELQISPKNTSNVMNKNYIENKSNYNSDDDYEELDDKDILALMSEGIILDECCGSEED